MKWIIFVVLLCTEINVANAIMLQAEKIQMIEVRNNQSAQLHINNAHYYRGYIRSESFLNSVVIKDAKGEVIKKIITTQTKEAEIFWFVDKPGRYHFEFNTVKDEPVQVEVYLTSLALKENQYLSPEEPIISPQMKQIALQIEQQVVAAEEDFWKRIEEVGTPLVEYTAQGNALLTFLYKGPANNVRVLGSPYGGHSQLTQLDNSDIWFHTFEVPNSTRLSYRIAPNIPQLSNENYRQQRRAVLATVKADPLNHRSLFSKGSASTLTLDDAPSDYLTKNSGGLKGEVSEHFYNNSENVLARKVNIYQPNKKYKVTNDTPVLIIFDGDAYLEKVPTPTILDNLIAQGLIPPIKAVFINPPLTSMRAEELTPNKKYAMFLADEFMPWLCASQLICPNASNTIISGSSYGGLASLYIAFSHPETFGKVLSLSGSFWWKPKSFTTKNKTNNWMAEFILSKSKSNVDVYLSAGLFETEPQPNSILQTNNLLYQTLQSAGYSVYFDEVAAGHDYFSWQISLAEGLITLLKKE